MTDEQKIEEILTRGVAEVIDTDNLRKHLSSGKKLRIKLGMDPTSPNLHLGRAVALLKLRDFQELGHQIILLVGNATGVIGDTSDKEAERPMLTHDDIQKNLETYKEQAGKLLDMDKVEVVYNADWLDDLGYREIGEHADQFSLHEFIVRDNIKKRLDAGKRVSLREVLYPLMQGYDSVHLKADVEVGGTDQRFNLLAGRSLQEHFDQNPQDILMVNLINGTDGRKMSSSWGNTINLMDSAREMGEKVMNISDDVIEEFFVHCTRVLMSDVEEICSNDDPREQKIRLAQEIVTLYHGAESANSESEYLRKKFITKELDASELESCNAKDGMMLVELLVDAGVATSKGDARRKIEQNAVAIDGTKITDISYVLTKEQNSSILSCGKKFTRRLVI